MKIKNNLFVILLISSVFSFNLTLLSPTENSTNPFLRTSGTHMSGDDHLKRVIVVNHSYDTYFDDFLYCAAIPAAIHWEGDSRHESLLVQDRNTRMVNNLYSDWDCYLDKIGGCQHVDYIGTISNDRKNEINGYYGNPSDIQQVSSSQDIYEAASDIATYYWGSERNTSIDTAVLCYVPEEDGGIEEDQTISGVSSGIDNWSVLINSSNIGWIDAEISWNDVYDSNYELSITDPYALHSEDYTTVASTFESQESQTNNVIHQDQGYEHITMSPYYSGRAVTDLYNLTELSENDGTQSFVGSVTNDNYSLPEYPFDDMSEHVVTGLLAGQTITALLNWTYVDGVIMVVFLYKYEESPFQDGTWEDYINFGMASMPPCSLSSTIQVDGDYSLCVWLYFGEGTIDYDLNATWTCELEDIPTETNWIIEQPNSGTDDYNYTITQYRKPNEGAITSVMNGAVAASLLDVPLLYTAGSTPEGQIISALEALNISNLIVIDPCDKIDESLWSSSYDINAYSDENSVFDYIYQLGSAKTGEKDVVIPAIGGAWFSTAALVGAYHAGPVMLPSASPIRTATSRSTIEWWYQIDLYVTRWGTSTSASSAPTWDAMTQMSSDTFSWLESLDAAFNPSCNDVNEDGVPDVGDSFDYSEDVDIVVVSPLNAIKLNFDGSLVGKASVGRFAFADPVLSGAWAARCMLYWQVGFSDADNYENPYDLPAETNHWDHAGYTFVAYTHDDGIIDDDLGDDADDDYPGGSLNRSYYMSDEFPQYAMQYGMSNEFNTNYTEVKTMLEDGLALWVHADHGSYNSMMETGDGFLGLSEKIENPWREYEDGMSVDMPNNSMGLVNPFPIAESSGADWYYGLNNVHSSMMYFQDCQFGASRGPLFFAELGATSMVADVCSMYIDPSPVYNDRLIKGLFLGYPVGAANRWAIDESGPLYSLHDPPPDFMGYSIQCVVYGDPELVLTTETLWIQANSVDTGYDNITVVDIQLYNQSGMETLPDTISVLIDNSASGVTLVSEGNGRYIAGTSLTPGKHVMRIEVSGNGYHDHDYNTLITKEYIINIPGTSDNQHTSSVPGFDTAIIISMSIISVIIVMSYKKWKSLIKK
ncbi:MAG: hypothetical protein ACFFAS_00410 [Promethearchaeota archaeon]